MYVRQTSKVHPRCTETLTNFFILIYTEKIIIELFFLFAPKINEIWLTICHLYLPYLYLFFFSSLSLCKLALLQQCQIHCILLFLFFLYSLQVNNRNQSPAKVEPELKATRPGASFSAFASIYMYIIYIYILRIKLIYICLFYSLCRFFIYIHLMRSSPASSLSLLTTIGCFSTNCHIKSTLLTKKTPVHFGAKDYDNSHLN